MTRSPSPWTLPSRRVLGLIGVATAVALAACIPASWGAGAILHPSRRPLTTPRPAAAAEVEIPGDGVRLRGWLFRSAVPRRGTVVYLHGSADNRASGVSLAARFLPSGFDVLMYDSRAHGESEGAACTYGFYEKRDLSRAIDALGAAPVAAIGVSLGGAVALQAAADDPRIVAVVAIASFSDLRTVVRERAPFFASRQDIAAAFALAEQQARFRADEVSPLAAAARIRVPVLLVHGERDVDTPPAHSERVFAALRGPKRLLLLPGAGHDDPLPDGVWHEIAAWLDAVGPLSAARGPS
jgi:pimeloyl-ACP methyl ester carboxylesterase